MPKINIPYGRQSIDSSDKQAVIDVLKSDWLTTGPKILEFENDFSNFVGSEHSVAVSSGTAALHCCIAAINIGAGDEVIVPSMTFVATANAIVFQGGTPVFADVDKDTLLIDTCDVARKITPKTKAIIPVHIYGQSCDMWAIIKIAKKYNLKVIEDCAEAHGAMYNEKKVGSFGDIGCFSFFGNKVITTGEGGMCVTNNLELDEKMRVLRDHGMSKTKRYWHDVAGYNYRMTNLQAAIGLAQLERIEEIHKNRREYENNYRKILNNNNNNFTFQNNIKNRRRITWLVSVLLDEKIDREKYIQVLKEKGIDARPFFYPLSDMNIYKSYSKNHTPIAHRLSKFGLNLPTYESLKSLNEVKNILEGIDEL